MSDFGAQRLTGRVAFVSGGLRGTVLSDRRNIHALAVRSGNRLALFGAFGVAEHVVSD